MDKTNKGIRRSTLVAPDTEIHSAFLVRLEDAGLSAQQGGATSCGTAVLAHATSHLLEISRRDGGFWNRFGVITNGLTGAKTAVLYVLADSELHLVALPGAESEVQELLADARKTGHLNVLWVTPAGDHRLSQVPFDEALVGLSGNARLPRTSDVVSTAYDEILAANYALSHESLREAGFDPGSLRRQVVHFLATKSMLDNAEQLAESTTVTKH